MLTKIILLLSYQCTLECDHCYLYCGPRAKGTFTLNQVRNVLNEAVKIGTIERIWFQGGEPFLFYPLMLEGMKIAHGMGIQTGTGTNGYWANSVEDAVIWLKPLAELGVHLGVSDDSFHFGDRPDSPARVALIAARQLNMTVQGVTVTTRSVVLRGRAVEKLSKGLPRRSWEEFNQCPADWAAYVDLESPNRIYVDPYGNVMPFCQGLSLGNAWEIPLSMLLKNYSAYSHPICGPLVRGGPALLAEEYNVPHEDSYVDECHFCYLMRRALIDRFPQYLAPRQVYGLGS